MRVTTSRDDYVLTVRCSATTRFGDLRDVLEPLTAGHDTRAMVLRLPESSRSRPDAEELAWLEAFPIPLVAVVPGAVAGAALDIALHCDIRICAARSEFMFDQLGGRRLLLLLGRDRTASLIAAGARCDAQSALAAGIVSLVADEAELDAEAARLAATIASRGPIATRFAKEAMRRGLPLPLAEALRIETDLTVLLQSTEDRAEGVAAFGQKRTPIFTGN